MKQFSSPGSCYHCLSQQTKIKKVDNGTILRRNVKCNVPKHLDDGLRSHGKYPKTNEMVPMWEVPLDLMHHFELGVFSRLIAEIFIETTTPLFMKIDVSEQELKDCLEIKLPSHYRALRLFFGKMTATEKGVFFMTALVRLALTNLLHPLVSLLILSLGALYTLLTSPVFQYQDIANQIEKNCRGIRELVIGNFENLLHGQKLHDVVFHLPDMVRCFGTLLPCSTKYHESVYHSMKRSFVTEITVNVGKTLLRTNTMNREMRAEVMRRVQENEDNNIIKSEFLTDLARSFRISRNLERRNVMKSVPDFVREFCFKDDEVCESVRLHGKRFSTVKTGKSDDTCVQFVEGDEVFYGRLVAIFIGEYRGIRFLLKRFRTSLAHLKLVMDRCLKTEGEVQKYRDIADVLSNSSFGATLTDYGAYVVVKSENVMGHAITSIVGNLLIVLPVTNRITCS